MGEKEWRKRWRGRKCKCEDRGQRGVDNHWRSTSVDASSKKPSPPPTPPRSRQTAPWKFFTNGSAGDDRQAIGGLRVCGPRRRGGLVSPSYVGGPPTAGLCPLGLDPKGVGRSGDFGWRVDGWEPGLLVDGARALPVLEISLGRGFHGRELFGTGDRVHVGSSCQGGRSPRHSASHGLFDIQTSRKVCVLDFASRTICSCRPEWVQ